MLFRVIYLYHWNACSAFNFGNLKKANDMTQKRIRSFDILKEKQQKFAKKYSIPYLSILPKVTEYKDLDNAEYSGSDDIKIINTKKRFIVYEFSCNYWELNLTIKSSTLPENPKEFVKNLKLNFHSVLGSAIHDKKLSCELTEMDKKTECEDCDNGETHLQYSIIVMDKSKSNKIKPIKHSDDIFKYHTWLVDSNYTNFIVLDEDQPIFSKFKNKSDEIKKIKKDIILYTVWSLSLVHGIKNEVFRFIEQQANKIPHPTKLDSTTPSNIKDKLFSLFFLRYYWINPDAISTSEKERFNISSKLRLPLLFAIDIKIKPDFWNYSKDVYLFLRGLPILLFEEFLNKLKMPIVQSYMYSNKLMNIAYETNLPTITEELNRLGDLDKKVIKAMITKLQNHVSQNPTLDSPDDLVKFAAITVNGILRQMNKKSGEFHTKVRDSLHHITSHTSLIFEVSVKDKISYKLRSGDVHYYLNSNVPHFRLFTYSSMFLDNL
ncbi:MAG: hypothetical protein OEZ01_02765 [Candidatus Heimdallarchaeota archaeon]|nr:hypothetical protein [Candidatus Heimdallarchaeota archaeon]MDH5644899.1 hypothetical protein [Candidatus Heimdallarchaeota archaeon]